MEWLIISFNWYLILLILGIIFFPITKKVLSKLTVDDGYPFAKTFAIVFLSYTIYLLSSLKILPFERISLFFLLIFFSFFNFFFAKKIFRLFSSINQIKTSKLTVIFFEELLFLFSFIFLVFIRGQEPSIRGLEKFMDFGFINSILRTRFFPPLDMWYSADNINPNGYPINYYYFGHLTGALLIKLTGIQNFIGYNLILATIFAQGITLVFSIVINLIYLLNKKISLIKLIFFGILGSYIVNLGGNLHTIYLFTKGYPNENPIPFWQILSWFNPKAYWYPNATRFIPFTIHEFPSYSYVVADLHGHVFDIPFVLVTLTLIFIFFITRLEKRGNKIFIIKDSLINLILIGMMIAVNYMTNAFDGPIYLLLFAYILFFLYQLSLPFFYFLSITILSFILFSLPFSSFFRPFVSGIGVNCSPQFLVNLQKIGPFLFEKDHCQVSAFWMLFVLWGFFWINFLLFLIVKKKDAILHDFIFILFSFGTILVLIPEFFYIKDIYPAHFRANTMFKLGYQAFIVMGIASTITFYLLKKLKKTLSVIIFSSLFAFIFIYPFFAFPSYYGNLDKTPNLDGSTWLKNFYPEDKEIIEWLNKNVKDQPVILEAQGDSYTDYERISAYTGLPTVAGWWVHEWLWRGSADFVGKRIPDIVNIYQSKDIKLTRDLIKKYHIKYVIISQLERQKYPNLYEEKFTQLGKKVFETSNHLGAIYQVKFN
jgi:uncharacterized membrane protein